MTAAAESTDGLELIVFGRLISSMESTVSRQMGHFDVCFRSSVAQSPHMHICLHKAPLVLNTACLNTTVHTFAHPVCSTLLQIAAGRYNIVPRSDDSAQIVKSREKCQMYAGVIVRDQMHSIPAREDCGVPLVD